MRNRRAHWYQKWKAGEARYEDVPKGYRWWVNPGPHKVSKARVVT